MEGEPKRLGPPYGVQPPGNWPTIEREWEGEIRVVPFCWSTFDVWPELWESIEVRRVFRTGRLRDAQRGERG